MELQESNGQVLPLVHAIVVTFRRPEVLGSCLAALLSQTRPPDSILVVDNDPNMSAVDVSRGHGNVEYLPTGINSGPAGGLSVGVLKLLETASEVDWILFVDDDDPPLLSDQLENLLRLAVDSSRKDPRVAAVGSVGGRYDPKRGASVRVHDRELVGQVYVDWIAGGQFPLYSVAAIRGAGPPDASLFFGFDDLEYGLRLGRDGWKIVVDAASWRRLREQAGRLDLKAATIRRAGAASAPWRTYYSTRNLLLIAHRYGRWSAGPAVVLKAVARLGRALTSSARRGEARFILRGIVDGLRRRSGRTVEPG